MSYEILLIDGTVALVQIMSASYKTWKVWKVQFDDGKEAMLYKTGNTWMQRNDDYLDVYILMTIGNCIDANDIENNKG